MTARQVYKFVGVNVAHEEFIGRYQRLGAPQLNGSKALETGDEEVIGRACEALATDLLVPDGNPQGADARSKFEMGRTKIFIRCVSVTRLAWRWLCAKSTALWHCSPLE